LTTSEYNKIYLETIQEKLFVDVEPWGINNIVLMGGGGGGGGGGVFWGKEFCGGRGWGRVGGFFVL